MHQWNIDPHELPLHWPMWEQSTVVARCCQTARAFVQPLRPLLLHREIQVGWQGQRRRFKREEVVMYQ